MLLICFSDIFISSITVFQTILSTLRILSLSLSAGQRLSFTFCEFDMHSRKFIDAFLKSCFNCFLRNLFPRRDYLHRYRLKPFTNCSFPQNFHNSFTQYVSDIWANFIKISLASLQGLFPNLFLSTHSDLLKISMMTAQLTVKFFQHCFGAAQGIYRFNLYY